MFRDDDFGLAELRKVALGFPEAFEKISWGRPVFCIMFRDDDFGLVELRKIALGFPEAFEKVSWGRPVFCAPKIFVMYGGNAKGDKPSEMTPYPYSMLVKVDDSDRNALAQDTRFFYPAYMVRRAGWAWISPRHQWTGTKCVN